MKKGIVALLCCLLLTGFAFAGGSSDKASSSSSDDSTLNVILCDSEMIRDLAEYFDDFTAETGIKVNYEIVAESSYGERMLLGLSSNNQQYDVVMTSPATLGAVLDGGLVQPLDPYIENSEITDQAWLNGLSDSMLSLAVRDGKRYAVPYNMGVSILFFNKAMLADAGLDPANPPDTMAEVLEAAKLINNPGANKYDISFRASRQSNANTFLWAMLWMFCGGSWEDENGVVDYSRIGDASAVEATEYFAEFSKYAPAGIANYAYEEAQLAFQQGLAAMWIDTSILAGNVLDPEKSPVAADVGFAALTDGHAIGSPWMFMMASRTKKAEAAWKFMQFVSGSEVQMEQVKSGVQTGPVRTDVLTDPEINDYFNAELADAVNYALSNDPISNYFPAINSMTEIRSLLAIAISDVALGQIDAQTAISQLQTDVHDVLVRDGVIEG